MLYAPIQQINTARHIARSAQRKIKDETGIQMNVLLCPAESTVKTPERMLYIIATALDMSPECYRIKSRARNITELRFLGALFIRRNFPFVTLHQVAALFGGQDHSSIINGVTRANNLIYTGDERFLTKYNTVLKAVSIWLRKEG